MACWLADSHLVTGCGEASASLRLSDRDKDRDRDRDGDRDRHMFSLQFLSILKDGTS